MAALATPIYLIAPTAQVQEALLASVWYNAAIGGEQPEQQANVTPQLNEDTKESPWTLARSNRS